MVRYRFRAYPTPGQAQALARTFGLRAGGLQRLPAAAAGRARGRGEGVRHRGATPGGDRGQGAPRSGSGWARSHRWRWCRRARTRGGPTATGSTRCRAAEGSPDRCAAVPVAARTTGSRSGSPATGSPCATTGGCTWRRSGTCGWSGRGRCRRCRRRCTVIREADGRYYVSFVVERARRRCRRSSARSGSTWAWTGSPCCRTARSSTTRDTCARRSAGWAARSGRSRRKQRGSANRGKAVRRVAVLHRKVRETRLDAPPQAGPAAGPRQPSGPPGETCRSPVWPGRNWPGRSTMRAGPPWSG